MTRRNTWHEQRRPVQTIESARVALDAGADVLVAQGNEAGGHTGQLGTLPFLAQVLDMAGKIPVIASGGIGSSRALAAVLAAGAEGAWIGTPLLATHEAVEVADTYKKCIRRERWPGHRLYSGL